MPAFKHIGTVEIFANRSYRLDSMNRDELIGTSVDVPAGSYPLLSDGLTYVWMMTGSIDGNSIRRGDGLFIMSTEGDNPLEGLTATFPSKFFGPDEWKELLADPVAREGHHEQRLRITILKEDN